MVQKTSSVLFDLSCPILFNFVLAVFPSIGFFSILLRRFQITESCKLVFRQQFLPHIVCVESHLCYITSEAISFLPSPSTREMHIFILAQMSSSISFAPVVEPCMAPVWESPACWRALTSSPHSLLNLTSPLPLWLQSTLFFMGFFPAENLNSERIDLGLATVRLYTGKTRTPL